MDIEVCDDAPIDGCSPFILTDQDVDELLLASVYFYVIQYHHAAIESKARCFYNNL
jgi:hypothetical protein